jgi:hypothetical protein
MDAMAGLYDAPYGAFEMKISHQKHMLIGIFLAILIIAWAVGAALHNIGSNQNKLSADAERYHIVRPIEFWDGSLPTDAGFGLPNVNKTLTSDAVGFIPDPDLVDEVAEEEPAVISRGPATNGTGDFGLGEGGDGLGGHSGGGGFGMGPGGGGGDIPPRGAFIRHEEPPVAVYEETPVYPKLALEGGFSAEVYLYAYVDKEGRVKKVEVVKCTRPGIGFEEAAEAATYKNIYRPAIQNGYPIGVWIAFKVKFIAK